MSKRRRIEFNDFELIQQQFLNFQELYNDVGIINIVGKYHCVRNEIGETTAHIKYDSYKEIFDNILREDKYTILLTDDSMLIMQYVFDESGKLLQHTLSFLPNYRSTILGEGEEIKEDADITPKEFGMRVSNYIRIDYGEIGRQDYYHALVHLHIGIFKDSIRLPLQSFLYPNEFLFLIFKYIYHLDDEVLSKLECEIPKQCLMKENEMKKLRMAFGNCLNEIILDSDNVSL